MPITAAPERRALAHRKMAGFDELLDQLVRAYPFRVGERPAPPRRPGVYLLASGDEVMHVGRTRNLQVRRRNQTSESGNRNVATFAFQLARHRARERHGAELPEKRGELEEDPRFVPLFRVARLEVRAMDFRCIEVDDHDAQAHFEIFAGVALNAPHASSRTH